MDIAFFIRRIIALVISLVMSFVPFFYNVLRNHESWSMIFSYKEVIFSLSAIMVLCFCDIIEIIKDLPVTLTLICFAFWFFALLSGIFIYVKPEAAEAVATIQNITTNTKEPQLGNIVFTLVTMVVYIFFNVLIAQNRKPEETQKC